MKTRIAPLAVLITMAVWVAAFASGCGGSNVDFSQWAGNYSGTITLDNNKSGVLTLSSDSNGLVSGELVVTGADGTDTNFKFTAGTYNLTGSVTSTGGGFEVAGAVPNNGNFLVRGQFPTTPTPTTFRIVTGLSQTFTISQTYSGTLNKD